MVLTKWFFIGVVLLAVSFYGVVHAARASLAHAMYHQAQYGSARDNPTGIFRRCENAYRLYPYNYYFCIWTAEKAYYTRFDVGKEGTERRLRIARRWCDAGLELNFYKSQLRLLKTRLLERNSVADAIKYWEEYVEWQFWEPYNHAVLVEMHATAGDFSKALTSLTWVEGSKHYAEASGKLRKAWQREMVPP